MGGRLKRAIRLLAAGASKTAGRNSAGRITSFHRGGGHKRSYRTFDLKRAIPSVGIVERIEYDPNRSGRIALVRWTQGVDFSLRKRSPRYLPSATPRRVLDRVAAPTMGIFSVLKGESNGRILERPKVASAISFTNPFFKLQCSKQKDVSRAKSASKSERKVLEPEPAAMKEVNSEKVVA